MTLKIRLKPIMKKAGYACFLLVLLCVLCACEEKSNYSAELPKPPITEVNNSLSANVAFPLQTYAVYEVYNDNAESEFDRVLKENPIDEKMQKEMQTEDLSGTREQQVFFNGYCELWRAEMLYSIADLETYLTDGQIAEFASAQMSWEKSINENVSVDQSLLQEMGVDLGTQVVASRLITVMNQYRERTFHIKYMTMLIENYVESPIPKDEQLWNNFKNAEGS